MSSPPNSPKPRRILLADDEEAVQLVVRRVAEKLGHQVISATRGSTVVEQAAQTRPDDDGTRARHGCEAPSRPCDCSQPRVNSAPRAKST